MKWAFLNGERLKADDAIIPINSPLAQYGYGIFETLCIQDASVLRFSEHWARLSASAKELSIPLQQTQKETHAQALELIKHNALENGALKILTYAGNPPGMLLCTQKKYYQATQYLEGFRLMIAPQQRFSQDPLARHKSCNYLTATLAKQTAQKAHCDEAIFLNEQGELCEGSFTNIFFVKDQALHTPALKCGLLPGIMRKEILDYAHNAGYPYKEGRYYLDDILNADEVFVTNALLGVMPARELGEKPFDLTRATFSMELAKAFSPALSLKHDVKALF
ncbi:MAG: aminotransferase class IV [Opitutales bacterium]|tara:strand:- start:1446 stop:2282 length:837 start_codon:yes stop_codon:yes gene_type:complete